MYIKFRTGLTDRLVHFERVRSASFTVNNDEAEMFVPHDKKIELGKKGLMKVKVLMALVNQGPDVGVLSKDGEIQEGSIIDFARYFKAVME